MTTNRAARAWGRLCGLRAVIRSGPRLSVADPGITSAIALLADRPALLERAGRSPQRVTDLGEPFRQARVLCCRRVTPQVVNLPLDSRLVERLDCAVQVHDVVVRAQFVVMSPRVSTR